jgi:hypothetical protein
MVTTHDTPEAAHDEDGNVILDPDDYAAMQAEIARLRAALDDCGDWMLATSVHPGPQQDDKDALLARIDAALKVTP